MTKSIPSSAPAFLAGGGRLAELIAQTDWSRAGLPVLDAWPGYMKTTTSLVLRCNLPMAIMWGQAGVLVYNDAYAAFSGSRHPALLGKPVRDAWPEVSDFIDSFLPAGLAGQSLSLKDQELVLDRHGSAEHRWLNLDFSPILDESGAPAGVLVVIVDNTAKVRAEQRYGDERERLGRMFEQAPSFMAMLDGPSHVFSLANPNYLKLVGNRAVVGLSVAQALPETVEQGYVRILDDVYRSGEVYTAYGARYVAQVEPGSPGNERFVDFVFQPIRSPVGDVTGIFVQGVDVTDRAVAARRREALIGLSETFRGLEGPAQIGYQAAKMLGETLHASRVGYGTIDHDADTLHVVRDWTAPGVESLAGVTPLRDYGSCIDSLKRDEFISISDVRLDPRTQMAAAALEGKSARSFVNLPVVERGRLVAVLFINDARVRDWTPEDLAFIHEVGVRTRTAVERAHSELALRASEARLREVNENLEAKVEQRTRELLEVEERFRQAQKMEAIGQLTGGIAHDFNNLLATMRTSLQVLKRRLQRNMYDDTERYIGIADESIRRAASLTQRLLAFSRRQTLDPKPTDVNRLVANLEDLVRRSVGPSVQVEVVASDRLWLTRVDPPQLENALLNLCINARDAMMPDGGHLRIETGNRSIDAQTAAEREWSPGQYVRVRVIDTGSGMTPEVIARAFDPFFTTKPIGTGTGLGLSMVYGFVRQSGGQVRVDSRVGEGTTMSLYLPRYVGEFVSEPDTRPAELMPDPAGGYMLVVEDETALRKLLVEELHNLGYQVIAVDNGMAAVEILRSAQPVDLLLTDVGLPGGLNGRQVADAGRALRPALKVLFITGYDQNAMAGPMLLEPGMKVLVKPFDIEMLAAKVRKMLRH